MWQDVDIDFAMDNSDKGLEEEQGIPVHISPHRLDMGAPKEVSRSRELRQPALDWAVPFYAALHSGHHVVENAPRYRPIYRLSSNMHDGIHA